MPTIAFWNVNTRVPADRVAALARERDVDVLVLAECTTPLAELLHALNNSAARLYFSDLVDHDRLRFPDLKVIERR